MGERLKGKTALVTGASRGIGKAIALALAEEGASVAINYQHREDEAREVAKLAEQIAKTEQLYTAALLIDHLETREHAQEVAKVVEELGGSAMICQANVSKIEEVYRMRDEVLKEFGKIDILVNNAGITRDKTLVKMTPEMWREVLSVNLDGVFYCTKAVVEGMIERRWGRIINTSSVVGEMGNIGQTNYAASKAGLIGFTKALARELAGKGITVNAIAPGFTETEMVASVPKNVLEKIVAQIPLGRLGRPREIARAVIFLASEDGDYITGQVLDVNGGLYM
ncbi:MAG: beta-ketoacyl-ACP reductase [Euryarchaeota archaeon]|nr:beta-ketoacyl-ACP reductase [Euryarchaeota archaeon]